MKRKEFNKLVRDKIPEIISSKGGNAEYKILDDDNYIEALNNKLLEECNEVINTTRENDKIEELADLLEVVMTLSGFMNIDFETIDKIRLKKRSERGGFDSRIFLKNATLVNL